MRIVYNASAMAANNALSRNDDALSESLQRLSSGLKINSARDNPAGLAMAKRMNAQIKGLEQANQNAADGISVIEIADGALSEVHEMVGRMGELATKAANGTLTEDDRKTIQDEIDQLSAEIERIASSTEFNTQTLLDGSFELKGYTDNEEVKVNSYSDSVATKIFTVEGATATYDADGNLESFSATFGDPFPSDTAVKEVKDNLVTIAAHGGFEMTLDLSIAAENGTTALGDIKVDVTGMGAMRLQVGANEGQVLPVSIPKISLKNMEIEDLDVTSEEAANEAMERTAKASAYISSVRSRLGAYQNRLEATGNNLDVSNENVTSAYSRIMDVDMAEEMTNYTTQQILSQAGTSMLAQANQRPSEVLQLLQ